MWVQCSERTLRSGRDMTGLRSLWSARVPGEDKGGNYKETMPVDHCMQINGNSPEPRPGISAMPDGLKACSRNIMDDILRVQAWARSARGEEYCPGDDAAVLPQAFTEVGTFDRRAT